MTAPTVEAAIHEFMDLAWNLVYALLQERSLFGEGLFVELYTGIHSWLDGPVRSLSTPGTLLCCSSTHGQ